MGYIFELILMFGMCACAVGMVYCSIALLASYIPTKQWDRKMENPPPPPDRKSFKERLSEKQKEDISILRNYVNYGYQPTNKVDTSNPPKETGT